MPLFRNNPALLASFREGHPAALAQVYRTYVRSMDRHIRGLARTHGRSEFAQPSAVADLLQEIFIRAFSAGARTSFDGLRDFGPYLAAIARNSFIDALRGRGREILLSPDEIIETASKIVADSSVEHDRDPRVLAMLTAYIQSLDGLVRAVYDLRFVQGRSQEEASAALGISRGHLRTFEKRLRNGLRRALARKGISPSEFVPRSKSGRNATAAPLSRVNPGGQL